MLERLSELLELELEKSTGGCLLENEPRSSATAASALNHWAISIAPYHHHSTLKIVFFRAGDGSVVKSTAALPEGPVSIPSAHMAVHNGL